MNKAITAMMTLDSLPLDRVLAAEKYIIDKNIPLDGDLRDFFNYFEEDLLKTKSLNEVNRVIKDYLIAIRLQKSLKERGF